MYLGIHNNTSWQTVMFNINRRLEQSIVGFESVLSLLQAQEYLL